MKMEFTKSSLSPLGLCRCVLGPLALLYVLVQPVSAATLRWTGGHATSSDWSRLANWDTGTAPVDGDTLVFPAGSLRLNNNNDIAGLQLTAIRFSGAGGGYVLGGNGVVLANGITATNSAGANSFNLARITLGANLFFTVAQNGAELTIRSEVRLNSFDLTCNTVGDLTLSGVITGTGNLFKNNNSTLTLNGPAANTYAGDTFVNGGVLAMNKSSGLAVPHRLIVGTASGGAHTDQARNLSNDQVNQVTVNASGLWDLNGFVEVVDDIELNAGGDIETGATGSLRLAFQADVSVTPSLLAIPDASRISGHLELLVGTHTFTIGEGSTLTSDSTELVIDADVSGLGGITKAGPGDLMLSGNNSFEAAVIVDAGELRMASNTALGTTTFGTTVNNDATLWMQGNVQVADEEVTLNSTGVKNGLNSRPALRASGLDNSWYGRVTFQIDSRVGVDTNGFLDFSRGLAGAGSIVKEGPGTLRFSVFDVSDFSGSVSVNSGLLELDSITPMPEFTLFTVGDGIGGPHADVLRNLQDLQVGEDPAVTSHGGNVHVHSSGYWDLGNHFDSAASASLFDGGDIDTGAMGKLSVHFYLQGNAGPSPFYDAARISGRLELVDSGVGGENVEIKALEGDTLSEDASDLVIDARVSGGGLLKSGAGDLLLSGNNSFSGTILIENGELRAGHPNALGADVYLVNVRSNATLWLQGDIHVASRLLLLESTGTSGGLNGRPALRASGTGNEWGGEISCEIDSRIGVIANGFLKLSGVLNGAGGLFKEEEGTLRLSVPDLNDLGGDIYVNAGILELAHGYNQVANPLFHGSIVVGDGIGGSHADVLRNLSDYQVGADLPLPLGFSYIRPVVVNGSGWWDLNGYRDVTTRLTLHDGGDVTTGANGIIAILIGLMADPGPAPGNDAARISGNVEFLAEILPVQVDEGDAGSDEAGLIISARISGEGLSKSGAGNLLLSGDNTFTGAVVVNNGELRAGHPLALGIGVSPILVYSNATLWLQGDISLANRQLWLDSSGQTGPNGDAALKITGINTCSGLIRLDRETRIGIAPDGVFRASGPISGPGGVVKEGPGSLVYLGGLDNTYAGTTRVAGGRLALWKDSGARCFGGDLVVGDGLGGADADVVECLTDEMAAAQSHVLVNTSGLLLVKNTARFGSIGGGGHVQTESVLTVGENNRSTQFDGPITGAGTINKLGNGTLTLTGLNTVAALFVFNGQLLANGSQPNTAVGVTGEGVLGGIGRVGLVLGTDGVIAPGASPGELKTGNLTLDPDVTYRVELDGSAPAGYDRLKVEGTVALGGAQLVLLPSFIPNAGQAFTIIDNDGADAVSGTFDGLAEGATIQTGDARFAVSYRGGDGNDVILTLLGPPPPCPEPVLSIRPLSDTVELSWPSCPSNFYQIAWTTDFQQWQMLTPPLAAPDANDVMTWTTPTSLPCQFFQLVVRPLVNAPVPANPGIYAGRTFTHGGITRQYRINIPESYTNGLPAPLMLALHGHDQTADSFASNVPNLATYANNAGVILVFPAGTTDQRGSHWNILDPTPDNPVDDVGFLLALIDELDGTLNIDRKRIYAAGFSNGGQMCHHLAARTTNVFAAFAAVGSAVAGGSGTDTLVYQPPPLEPNSILIVNALNDCKRPYFGGTNMDGVLQPPARDSLTHWTSADFCTPSPVLTTNIFVTNHIHRVFADCAGPYPPFNAPKTNFVIREHYQTTCAPDTEVLFVTLSDGGHSWPEVADNVGFDTSREVLEFLLRHCRCDALGATDSLVIPTLPGKYELRLCDQNFSRLFRLQIPAGYNPAVAAPLVFVFHGGGQTADSFSSLHPDLFAKCNAEGMLLVLPQALPNPLAGDTLWSEKPFDVVVDDVAFVTNLIERLDGELNVDRGRVYATGYSSGGDFSHWLGSTTTGLLAAIAPVCHTMGWVDRFTGALIVPPPPLEPMAVMMVRGGMDPKRPFNGSATAFSAQADAQYWASGSTCAVLPAVTSAPGVMRWQYAPCAGTTEVILIRVDNMGHEWPDGPPFNANTQIIDFLLTHSR